MIIAVKDLQAGQEFKYGRKRKYLEVCKVIRNSNLEQLKDKTLIILCGCRQLALPNELEVMIKEYQPQTGCK